MPLTTYAEARPWARAIREEVLTRRMPKWHAARGYGDFSNDPSLSPFEIALIVAWADGGAPLGTDADLRNEDGRRKTEERRSGGREVPLACRDQPLPEGLLLALRPSLPAGESLGLAVSGRDGRTEVLAWIRDFDPEFATTYLLRRPLDLPPGSRLIAHYSGRGLSAPCTIHLRLEAPRSQKAR
jgi:hypothetical protein